MQKLCPHFSVISVRSQLGEKMKRNQVTEGLKKGHRTGNQDVMFTSRGLYSVGI